MIEVWTFPGLAEAEADDRVPRKSHCIECLVQLTHAGLSSPHLIFRLLQLLHPVLVLR